MPPRVSVLITLVLLTLLGASGAFIAHRLENPPRLALLAPAPASPDPLLEGPVGNAAEQFALGSIDQYQETVERPLFINTRRPPPPPEPEAPEPMVVAEPEPVDERDYTLVGVMVTPEATTALLRDDRGSISRLRVGEKIGDWQLEQVNDENVVLRQGTRVKDIPLLRNQTPQLGTPQQTTSTAGAAPQPNAAQEDPRELRRRLLQQHRALRQKMEQDVRNQPQAVPRASATK